MSYIVVHKQHLIEAITEIKVSAGAFKLLHVDEQNGVPTIWYETVEDPIMAKVVKFTYIGTGMQVLDNSVHVGSCKCGSYVWHVYQLNGRK